MRKIAMTGFLSRFKEQTRSARGNALEKSVVKVCDPVFPFLRAFASSNWNAHWHGDPSRRVPCILQTSCHLNLPRSYDNKIIMARDSRAQQTTFLGCGGLYG